MQSIYIFSLNEDNCCNIAMFCSKELIHKAVPESRPEMTTVYTRFLYLSMSVPTFPSKRMTEAVGLSKWIIDDYCFIVKTNWPSGSLMTAVYCQNKHN